jgi:Protein of unknown function (DUF2808)
MLNSQILRQLLPCLVLSSCLVAVVPISVKADSLPGFVLFSGVDRSDQLSYRLESGDRNATDRYYLRIPGSKIDNRLGAGSIQITYPEYYKGKFDDKNVEVLVGDKAVAVKSVKWDRQKYSLQIDLAENVKTDGEIQVVLNNVKNPDLSGMFYFNCQVKSSAEFPVARYVGTWILSID